MKINDEANAIQVDKQEANCDAAAFAAALVESEPRFYVFKRAMGGVVFVMGVPDKSAPKLRMVYSTAKANVSDALAAAGVTLSKKLEWDSADFKEFAAAPVAFLKQQTAPSARFAGGGGGGGGRRVTPAASKAKTNQAHPIYSLMSGDDAPKRGGKKIVIPPRSACESFRIFVGVHVVNCSFFCFPTG